MLSVPITAMRPELERATAASAPGSTTPITGTPDSSDALDSGPIATALAVLQAITKSLTCRAIRQRAACRA